MSKQLHTQRDEQRAEDNFHSNESKVYLNFEMLSNKDTSSSNRSVMVLLVIISVLMGAYIISIFV